MRRRSHPSRRLRVMSAITGGYAFLYTTRLPLSVAKKPLIDAGLFSAEELSLVGSALFSCYAVGKLVNGFLLDHVSARRAFATGILVSAVINLLMGSTTGLWCWVILWGLNGWFQSLGGPAAIATIARWFEPRRRGTYLGLWATSHCIGEGLTFIGTAALVRAFDWRFGFRVPGLLGIVAAVLVFRGMSDAPVSTAATAPAISDTSGPLQRGTIFRSQLAPLRSPLIWLLGLSSAAIYITRYAVNSWGAFYLQEARGYSLTQASAILMVSSIAGLFGSAFLGIVSDGFFGSQRLPMTLGYGVLQLLSLSAFFYTPSGHPVILLVAAGIHGFAMGGLLTSLNGLCAVDLFPEDVIGAVTGVIGSFSYFAAAIQERVSGYLIERGATIVGHERTYVFDNALRFWIGSSVVSALVVVVLWLWSRSSSTGASPLPPPQFLRRMVQAPRDPIT